MISIIISSVDRQMLDNVIVNIKETIGIAHEVIAFENSGAKLGICEVYNKGIAQAQYELICFMHEDLIISTKDWGLLVQSYFDNDRQLGLLGIAGSSYKALCPSSWFSWVEKANRFNMIQRFKHRVAETELVYNNPEKVKLSQVSAVDGVWFCTRRQIAKELGFDNIMLKGFHGYDVDFSLSVGQQWNVAVSFEILLEHFSEGHYDCNWLESALLIHEKWKHILPVYNGLSLDRQEVYLCEKKAFLFLIEKMSLCGHSKNVMYKLLWKSQLYRVIGTFRFMTLHKYIYRL